MTNINTTGGAASEGRLFRFVQWNDMHVRDPFVVGRHRGYPGGNEKARWALECALGMHEFERPDLVVSAGDMIDGECGDYAADFAMVRRGMIEPLGVPILPCLGNHENRQGEGQPALNEAYDQAFGPRWHNYAYTVGGFGFIVVDSSGGDRLPDAITAARTAFLERALRQFADLPLFIVTHIPLIAMREPAVLAASFGFSSWFNRDPSLLALIQAHRSRVIAVLSGHLHITSVRLEQGVHYIVPAGTAGFPSDFASFDVYPDRVHVRMHRPPEGLLASANPLGNIHGKPRHPHDFVDSDHVDHATYLWGNPSERDLVIPLTGARRPAAGAAGQRLCVFQELAPGHWEAVGAKVPV